MKNLIVRIECEVDLEKLMSHFPEENVYHSMGMVHGATWEKFVIGVEEVDPELGRLLRQAGRLMGARTKDKSSPTIAIEFSATLIAARKHIQTYYGVQVGDHWVEKHLTLANCSPD